MKNDVQYYIAICDKPEFKIIQEEPYSQMQIRDICFVHNVRFVDVKDCGIYRFYKFKR